MIEKASLLEPILVRFLFLATFIFVKIDGLEIDGWFFELGNMAGEIIKIFVTTRSYGMKAKYRLIFKHWDSHWAQEPKILELDETNDS